jgi:hypothetical protein
MSIRPTSSSSLTNAATPVTNPPPQHDSSERRLISAVQDGNLSRVNRILNNGLIFTDPERYAALLALAQRTADEYARLHNSQNDY